MREYPEITDATLEKIMFRISSLIRLSTKRVERILDRPTGTTSLSEKSRERIIYLVQILAFHDRWTRYADAPYVRDPIEAFSHWLRTRSDTYDGLSPLQALTRDPEKYFPQIHKDLSIEELVPSIPSGTYISPDTGNRIEYMDI